MEELRNGEIKTKYAIVKAGQVLKHTIELNSKGLFEGIHYFVLGKGSGYCQIHIIKGASDGI